MNEQNQPVMSEDGEVFNAPSPEPSQGQLIPAQSIDQMLARRVGGGSNQIVTCFNANNPVGQAAIMRHVQADIPKGTIDSMLNVPFNLTGYTMRTVTCLKDANGERLAEPKVLIRSTMETDDGMLIASASDYLAQDLRMIHLNHPNMSAEHPIKVMVRKGGLAHRLIDMSYPGDASGSGVAGKTKAIPRK